MNSFINKLKDLIIDAGQIALTKKAEGLFVDSKKDNSPVSNADIDISDFIYKNLTILTPDIPIICEERPLFTLSSNTFWLIDPIDGTRSYVKNKDTYTVNIGLIKEGVPTIGLIYQPEISKLYYTDGVGGLKIEELGIIRLSKDIDSSNYKAVLSSSFLNEPTRKFLNTNDLSEIISIPSSIKLCLIAEGAADIYPRFGQTMEWDIAAGHALIKSTGGDIVDSEGRSISYGKVNFENPHFFASSKRWLAKKIFSSTMN